MLSPLRYPGGKSDFASTAYEIVRSQEISDCTFVEPFAGSAIVALSMLESGVASRAILIEKDPLVYSFWKALFTRTDELLERFIDLKIDLETWHALRPLLKIDAASDKNVVDLGLACLFYNRSNFSGILDAGPIGGMSQKSAYAIDCRTNKDELIVRLLAAATFASQVDVRYGDAAAHLDGFSERNSIVYVDPPYFLIGELLYRHFYKMGDHKKLASVLSNLATPWFLSYDVHHVIEYLYSDFSISKLNFRYSAHSPKNHDELLISNFPISAEVIESPIVRAARQAHSYGLNSRGKDMDRLSSLP